MLLAFSMGLYNNGSRDVDTLNFNTLHFVNTRNEKKQGKKLPSLRSVCGSLNLRNIKRICMEKVAGGQGLPSSHINSIRFSDLKMLSFPEYKT